MSRATLQAISQAILQSAASSYARPRPGEACIYHRGHLLFDRLHSLALDRVAQAAWEDCRLGYVHLVQRRMGPQMCAYMAIGRVPE